MIATTGSTHLHRDGHVRRTVGHLLVDAERLPTGVRDPRSAVRSVASASGGASTLVASLQRQVGNAATRSLLGRSQLQRDAVLHDAARPLRWEDFRGIVPRDATHSAATASGWAQLGEMFSASHRSRDGTYTARADADVGKMDIRSYVDTGSSWVRPEHRSSSLLRHEQGHFDITHVIGERTESKMKGAARSVIKTGDGGDAEGRAAAAAALDEVAEPVLALLEAGEKVHEYAQCRYDGCMGVGTNHGLRATQQARWERWISMGLPTFVVPLSDVDARMTRSGCPEGDCSR